MSTIIHKGGKVLKSAVALRVGKALLKKRILVSGIGLAGLGILAAAGTGYMVYSLAIKEDRTTTKRKVSKILKKLSLQ